jgi:hypothetical protein
MAKILRNEDVTEQELILEGDSEEAILSDNETYLKDIVTVGGNRNVRCCHKRI